MSAELVADFEKRFASGTTVHGEFRVPAQGGGITVFFGPSGCGKTTLLRCLAGLERPQRGRIAWQDEVWYDSRQATFVSPQRRGIGLLFQEYALFPHLSVAGNVAFALASRRSKASRRRVAEALGQLRIAELADRYPAQLSGGQSQRVALARAIACRPRLLLLDEPLSALDAPVREQLRGELRKTLLQLGRPAIIVTHDRTEALALADNVVVLVEGRVRQTGPVQSVFNRPRDASIAQVVGVETVEPGVILHADAGLATIQVGRTQLTAVAAGGSERDVFVCIRGEDVILQRSPTRDSSARNQFPARVTSTSPEGPLVRVGLDCGFSLTALVTRPAAEEMHLQVGAELFAVIKAPSIHLVARPGIVDESPPGLVRGSIPPPAAPGTA